MKHEQVQAANITSMQQIKPSSVRLGKHSSTEMQ